MLNNLHTFDTLDIFVLLLYVTGGLLLCRKFSDQKHIYLQIIPYLIVILHLLSTILFYFFVVDSIGDAKGYYLSAANPNSFGENGFTSNGFVESILYPFINYLDFSFFSASLLFSFISLSSFILLYNLAINLLKGFWSPWLFCLLLPSMHFWTAAVGKDALVFFGVTLLFYNYLNKKSIFYYLIASFFIGFTRFYILSLLGIGIGVAIVLLSNQITFAYKVFFTVIFTTLGFFVMPIFLQSISINEISNISKQSEIIINANMEGGGAVDLQGSNLVIKWFSYIFRPFIFEANSSQMLIAGFENLFWLVIFWKIWLGIKYRKFLPKRRTLLFWVCIISIFTVTLPSSFILSNFGISSRQKIMIVPLMLYLLFESLLAEKLKKSSYNQIVN